MLKEPTQSSPKKAGWLSLSRKIHSVVERFSLTEKVIFYFFVVLLAISTLALVWQVNEYFLVQVPDYGGTLTEGVVGSARFINPLLAISDTDKDLSELMYSGLLRADSSGALVPDLAQSYTISPDGLTYTFVLRKNATFQDGTKVTADDVIFTVLRAQDTNLKSPRKASWDGIIVTKIDDSTVEFSLRQPYSPFIQNLTLGILPKHIWSTATTEEFPFSQYNIKPVGSGPYQVESIVYASSGLPREYHLKAFNAYALGKPYISTLIIKSYADETSLVAGYKNGEIESMHGVSSEEVTSLKIPKNQIALSPLPRVFGLFFNQNVAPVFVYKEVRTALDTALDKDSIVQNVLGGYGQSIDEPIPPVALGQPPTPTDASSTAARIQAAQAILTKAGWVKDSDGIFQKKDKKGTVTLAFSISTGDAPELKATALELQKQWQAMGAQVGIKIFEVSDLNQNIIRPRKYDALLFGEIIGRDLDLYPFWHSSERNDPGLNIALYTNITADKILENLRETTDPETQHTLYEQFNQEIETDTPAVFVYSPDFVYVVPTKVHNINLGQLNAPAERFEDIYKWYIETNSVWKIFTK